MMNNKADPNIRCEGESPLYIASFQGRTEIVELLLNNKADPNIFYYSTTIRQSLYDRDEKRCIMENFLHNIY
jgi:ankyrin repeat protein